MWSRKDAGCQGWAGSQTREVVVPCEVKKKSAKKTCTSLNLEGYLQDNFWRGAYRNDSKDFFSKAHEFLCLCYTDNDMNATCRQKCNLWVSTT